MRRFGYASRSQEMGRVCPTLFPFLNGRRFYDSHNQRTWCVSQVGQEQPTPENRVAVPRASRCSRKRIDYSNDQRSTRCPSWRSTYRLYVYQSGKSNRVHRRMISDDWKLLAKRLIAANQLGIRIYQEDGHRWIDLDSSSPHWTDFNMNLRRKQYGSWSSALDAIDEVLTKAGKPALEKHFDQSINYHDDLGVIFGEGVQ